MSFAVPRTVASLRCMGGALLVGYRHLPQKAFLTEYTLSKIALRAKTFHRLSSVSFLAGTRLFRTRDSTAAAMHTSTVK